IHVVQQGETIARIAQRYGADMNQVILVNQLAEPDVLVVGQTLVVPEPDREYFVQPGDQLWQIAELYGVTVVDLASANNIADPSMLTVGDLLEMPYVVYSFESGESLWRIADHYGVSVAQIVRSNHLSDPPVITVGQRLHIPVGDRPVIDVNAYTTNINEEGGREARALGSYFTYLAPFMHSMREDGSVTELQDAPLLEAAEVTNTNPLFVLTNFRDRRFDSDLAAAVLRHPEVQDILLANILALMRNKGYTGLNIDFEYVYPEDRENYNAFLQKAADRLHPEGYTVSTAMAPKENAGQQGLLYEAHDYAAHGRIADFVIIMTYEWGWAGGRPWAIAPINMVRRVLDYAVSVIPRDKLVMGVPL